MDVVIETKILPTATTGAGGALSFPFHEGPLKASCVASFHKVECYTNTALPRTVSPPAQRLLSKRQQQKPPDAASSLLLSCCMMLLPDELLLEILGHLDTCDLLRVSMANTRLSSVGQDESLWQKLYLRNADPTNSALNVTRSYRSCMMRSLEEGPMLHDDLLSFRRLEIERFRTPRTWEQLRKVCRDFCNAYALSPADVFISNLQILHTHCLLSTRSVPIKLLPHELPTSLCLGVIFRPPEVHLLPLPVARFSQWTMKNTRGQALDLHDLPRSFQRVRVFCVSNASVHKFYNVRFC